MHNKSKISVIIPTLNEEGHIEELLNSLQLCEAVAQVIIVDGGSTDATKTIVKRFKKVALISASPGRASQMNAGAQYAQCEILLFLHADSIVEIAALSLIPTWLTHHLAGSFYLKFDHKHTVLDIYSTISKENITVLTYGDQGLFLNSATFIKVGGFKNIPLMEDLDMVRRLKRMGSFFKADYPIITSSRRFLAHGIIRQQLKNMLLVSLYYIGASPKFLSKFYRY